MEQAGTSRRGPRRWDYAYDRSRRPERTVRPKPKLPKLSLPAWGVSTWLLATLGAMVLVFLLLLYNSSMFEVKDIDVTGQANLNRDVVVELSEAGGVNLFTVRLGKVEERLEQNPYIESATVTRDWPDGIDITIVERQPVGVWQVGSQSFLVDHEGFVLGALVGDPPRETLPIVAIDAAVPTPGERIDADALALVPDLMTAVPRTTGERILSFEYSSVEGLTAITESGVRIVFGDSKDYEYKLAALGGVFNEARGQALPFSVIDLRFGESPALR
ncbi:MAG TPA: FtsQ-type POTRA domain-containing protein [Dehalococcoidia bacterium]|nr:FtsQ-type POTRA domain-containing protein [Dehalococcoidia bacterium]